MAKSLDWMTDIQAAMINPRHSIDDIARLIQARVPPETTDKDASYFLKKMSSLVVNKSIPFRNVATNDFFSNKVTLFKGKNPQISLIAYLAFVIISIRQERWRIARSFQLPEIESEKKSQTIRRHIASALVKESAEQVTPLFSNLGITSVKECCYVLLNALLYNPNTIKSMDAYVDVKALSPDLRLLLAALKEICSSQASLHSIECKVLEVTAKIFPEYNEIRDSLLTVPKHSLYEYRNNIVWFLTYLGKILLLEKSDRILKYFQKYHIFPLLLRSSLPKIKNDLVDFSIKIFSKEELTLLFESSMRKRKIKPDTNSKGTLAIVCIIYWIAKGLPIDQAHVLIDKLPLREFKKGNNQAHLFHMLIRFIHEADIYQKELVVRIIEIFQIKEVTKRLKALTQLYFASLLGCFDDILKENSGSKIEDRFFKIICANFPEIQPTQEFMQGYEKAFAHSAYPDLLPAYIADLSLLPEDEKQLAFSALGKFILSVIEGDFQENRYNIDRSRHLEMLHQINPEIITLWRRNSSMSIDDETVIEETDAPLELLSSANNVPEGNCQRIPGEFTKNKAALGDVLQGQMKLISVKNHGATMANVYMILLIDPEINAPVLLLDELYPARISEKDKKHLIDFALTKSNELNVSLVSVKNGGKTPYPRKLISYKGPAPFAFCDALVKICEFGEYELPANLCKYVT